MPFVRVWPAGGVAEAIDGETEAGRRMFAAAEALVGDVDSTL